MIRIGIICPSEIALRRFLPALSKLPDFKYVGVAIAGRNEWDGVNDKIIENEKKKATAFVEQYGGKIFDSYNNLIHTKEIDAIYLPLPPALHYHWARQSLMAGKHILVEKPATTSYKDTKDLISLARQNRLAMHENYMFAFHAQLNEINNIIKDGELGDIRLFRISFGFPRRSSNDFRYNKKLGGGALMDCGGYTIKYASMLLGETTKLLYAQSNYIDDFDVDISGSAALVNEKGTTAQIAFGMDNSYKCDLEAWGSKGCLTTGRVLTAPDGFVPEASINTWNKNEIKKLSADDAFKKSIQRFHACIGNETIRQDNYADIERQALFVDHFRKMSNPMVRKSFVKN